MNIESILSAGIGSSTENGRLRMNFKKTINIRQYETEVIEASLDIPITPNMTGAKLEMIESVALAKIEYGIMWNLLAREMITQEEFNNCKLKLENDIEIMSQYTGVSIDSLME